MRLQIKISVLALGALLCGGVMFFTTYKQNQKSPKSIILKNVNALARSESEGDRGNKVSCYNSFTDFMIGENNVRECGTCTRVKCSLCWDSGTCRVK